MGICSNNPTRILLSSDPLTSHARESSARFKTDIGEMPDMAVGQIVQMLRNKVPEDEIEHSYRKFPIVFRQEPGEQKKH